MCNLNIICKEKKFIKSKEDLVKLVVFLQNTTANSYASNHDGEGFYAGGFLVKSLEKINMFLLSKQIHDSDIILTHQRQATSGFSSEFTQPFEDQDFVIAHNGIINDFLGKNGSDTFGFFNRFVKEFNKSTGSRDERIVKSVKKLLDKLDGGTYSIALIDKNTNILYYFKDDFTTINFYSFKRMLYISTSSSNEVFLSDFGKFKKLDINPFKIYRIKVSDKVEIKEIAKIKHKKQTAWKWVWDDKKSEEPEEDKEEHDINEIFIGTNAYPCKICHQPTHNMVKGTYEVICDDCLETEKIRERIKNQSQEVFYV